MHFTIYKDRAGGWRWRLVAGNNETIADSAESYTTKASAQAGLELVKLHAASAPVRET
jgi:hypothetical protein